MKKTKQLNSKILSLLFYLLFVLTGCEKPERPANLTIREYVSKTQELIINFTDHEASLLNNNYKTVSIFNFCVSIFIVFFSLQ